MPAPLESNLVPPLPHRIPALEKEMSGRLLRFTVADEVGIGKTNEPGLLLNERKPRGIVNRSLIVVPQSAIGQWQQEMKIPFNALFRYHQHPLWCAKDG